MAIFSMNENYEENELFDESGDILDNMLEACDQMMNALGESDRSLKNERNVNDVHGPEDYSKWPTKDLKDEFKFRRDLAKNSKDERNSRDNYSQVKFGNYKSDPYMSSASNRRKAESIGKEIAKRDKKKAIKETCLTILSMIDDI